MSTSLLKKSLEMFQDDFKMKNETSKKKKSNPMKLISTKRHGIKRELQKLKHQQEAQRKLKLNKKRQKTAAEYVAYLQSQDQMSENLHNIQRLAALSGTNKDAVTKILEHQRGKLAKDQPKKPLKEPEPTSILFANDRDFDNEEAVDDFFNDNKK